LNRSRSTEAKLGAGLRLRLMNNMSDSEKRVCQNCRSEFIIDASDFAFYEKISVPAPTFCPECRMVRRAQFRNEWNFYKRPCGLCGSDTISIYPKTAPFPVYCAECYWSDRWDPSSYGREYDFSKSFFEQYLAFMEVVPRIAIMNVESVNSIYTHLCAQNRNCYLLVESSFNENLQYGYWMQHSKDSIDNAFGTNIELCYETVAAFDSYRLNYSSKCFGCSHSWFLKSCTDCQNCFGCINLRHKKYCFFNKQLSKTEYETEIKKLNLHTWEGVVNAEKRVREFYLAHPNSYADIHNCSGSTGNYMTNSKNCRSCFYCMEAQDSKYSVHILQNIQDCYDVDTAGMNASLLYETMNTALSVQRVMFSSLVWSGHDIFYSENLVSNCENCFGCISLNKKSYCILNKQYSKEEYLELLPMIIEQMGRIPYRDVNGYRYSFGEFFPIEFSVFGYNQTVAQDYFPLSELDAKQRGYRWIQPEEKNYKSAINAIDFPNQDTDFMKYADQVIGCMHNGTCGDRCTKVYRFTQEELLFYESMNLSLPRLCPNCRHSARIRRLNSFRLWHRRCTCAGVKSENEVYQNTASHFHGSNHCPNEFETSYAPERPEIVYCEKCYQGEVV
jgi:hypothetical protein